MDIDWPSLAERIGSEGRGGSDAALRAIAVALGDDALIGAVEHYVSAGAGAELARSVLWLLHPRVAMERCYAIYERETDIERRRAAVELLRVVADGRVLGWAKEFLSDPDPGIQWCGAGMIDQLLFSELAEPDECTDVLEVMKRHANVDVRKQHSQIMKFLHGRSSAVG